MPKKDVRLTQMLETLSPLQQLKLVKHHICKCYDNLQLMTSQNCDEKRQIHFDHSCKTRSDTTELHQLTDSFRSDGAQ